ncbi:MAG: hypothetical protein P8H13_07995 [Polaribacter sp.]|nr:hypothetical protein [Polaribacter sp.]MDG1811865.1 hypothetical protein [Polaribacter sp.]MDG1993015.1 hypothetical protein [Polaribacter sp.]
MTLTTTLNINGNALSSSKDRVAAFIDGEVRGVAKLTYVASRDKYVAYLVVFANTNSKTVNFKLYDGVNDAVTTLSKTVQFAIDSSIGSVFQSISLASPPLKKEAIISNFYFKDIQTLSSKITTDSIHLVVPIRTDITKLTANFTVSNSANVYVNRVVQKTNTTVQNYATPITFEVLSEDEATLNSYVVSVKYQPTETEFTAYLFSPVNEFSNQNPLQVVLNVNSKLTSLEVRDFLLENAIIQSIKKEDEFNYLINLVAKTQGAYSISLPKNTLLTEQNKTNPTTEKLDFIFDTIRPHLISIERVAPTEEYTNSNRLEFLATFSEEVFGFFPGSISSGPFNNVVIAPITNKTYKILLLDATAFSGRFFIEILDSGSITDLAGNPLRNTTLTTSNND